MISKKVKLIIGWSAKCGCSHMKAIFKFLEDDNVNLDDLHTGDVVGSLPEDFSDYLIILIIRNPYERIISGFLDKYSENGNFRKMWNLDIPLTFSNFVDKVVENHKVIENHHFTPQLSENFDDRLRSHKNLLIYDLKNIDYTQLENIYKKNITNMLLSHKGKHCYQYNEIIDIPIFDLLINEYKGKKPLTRCFYNDNIKRKIDEYYKVDFDFFRKNGFNYII